MHCACWPGVGNGERDALAADDSIDLEVAAQCFRLRLRRKGIIAMISHSTATGSPPSGEKRSSLHQGSRPRPHPGARRAGPGPATRCRPAQTLACAWGRQAGGGARWRGANDASPRPSGYETYLPCPEAPGWSSTVAHIRVTTWAFVLRTRSGQL
jgi:hypothetical protein